MAHGPVNKSYYLSIDEKILYKVKQADYDSIKEFPNSLIRVYVNGSKTSYTVIIPADKNATIDKLTNDGFKLSKGRTYVKFEMDVIVYDE